MKHKAPGTSGLMPVKGSGCGIRPDLDEMGEDTGFDFSKAADFLPQQQQLAEKTQQKPENSKKT